MYELLIFFVLYPIYGVQIIQYKIKNIVVVLLRKDETT